MLTLEDLAKERSTVTVNVRGKDVTLTALSVSQMAALRSADPQPRPPLGPDPRLGSKAPPVERPDDPDYVKKFDEWFNRQRIAVFAVAAGYRSKAEGSFETARTAGGHAVGKWINAAYDELSPVMGEFEMQELAKEVRKLGDTSRLTEEALGN